MRNPPRYDASIDEFNGCNVLRIWDVSDSYPTAMSVTNGAEYVLNELEKENGKLPEIIIYKDTLGCWSRMARTAAGGVEFSPIQPGVMGDIDDDVAAALAVGGKQ